MAFLDVVKLINQLIPFGLTILVAIFAIRYRNIMVTLVLLLSVVVIGFRLGGLNQDDIIIIIFGQILAILLAYIVIQYMRLHWRIQHSQSLLHLVNILQGVNDAIFGKDLNGTIVSWNRGAENLYGYTAAEVIGRDVRMLAPGHESEIDGIMASIRRGRAVGPEVVERTTKAGKNIKINIEVEPVIDGRGVIIGAATIAREAPSA